MDRLTKMELTEYLISKRNEHNLDQHQLAQAVGMSQPAISRWELGYSLPTFRALRELSKLYGVSADEILSKRIY